MFSFYVGILPQKDGEPSEYELEKLSEMVGNSWEKLARRLGFHEGEITGFHKDNEELSKKASSMLIRWEKKTEELMEHTVFYTMLFDMNVSSKKIWQKRFVKTNQVNIFTFTHP